MKVTDTKFEMYENEMSGERNSMVKFNRDEIISALGNTNEDVNITISGSLSDGKSFEGSATIKVIH